MGTLCAAYDKPLARSRMYEPTAQRVVHTRVVGAHAYFEVYEPLVEQIGGQASAVSLLRSPDRTPTYRNNP